MIGAGFSLDQDELSADLSGSSASIRTSYGCLPVSPDLRAVGVVLDRGCTFLIWVLCWLRVLVGSQGGFG